MDGRSRGRRDGHGAADQIDSPPAPHGRGRERVAHPPARSVAEKTHRIEMFPGGSGGDQTSRRRVHAGRHDSRRGPCPCAAAGGPDRRVISDARPPPRFKAPPPNQNQCSPPAQTASAVCSGAWRAKPARLLQDALAAPRCRRRSSERSSASRRPRTPPTGLRPGGTPGPMRPNPAGSAASGKDGTTRRRAGSRSRRPRGPRGRRSGSPRT